MLDPLLLRTFLVIAQGNSFSDTSRQLSMRQSTVSDHVRRLEAALGCRLFVRDTHSVVLTPEGEALIGYAQTILDTAERAERHLAGTPLRAQLRFGAAEDLAPAFLPAVLRDFTRAHPVVDVDLTVAPSAMLVAGFDRGDLDVVVCERGVDDDRGDLVWRDEIAWIGLPGSEPPRRSADGDAALPLVLRRPPSISRSIVVAALSRAGIAWRPACTSDSFAGVVAATRAGLGISVCARRLLPPDLATIAPTASLPPLGSLDIVMLRHAGRPRAPAQALAAAIIAKGRGI